MVQAKDYEQIIEDIRKSQFLLLKPMDVRELLQLDTKATYDLFNENEAFPSIKISGRNYIMKDKLVAWAEKEYGTGRKSLDS